jgi:hypothetical protein
MEEGGKKEADMKQKSGCEGQCCFVQMSVCCISNSSFSFSAVSSEPRFISRSLSVCKTLSVCGVCVVVWFVVFVETNLGFLNEIGEKIPFI